MNVPKGKRSAERRYQRASCDFPAEFTWGTITHQAEVRVISIGGCFLSTPVLVPVEEELDSEFRLSPNDAPIHCRGKVVWLSKRGIRTRGDRMARGFALEFMRIYPEDRARIDEYVRVQNRLFKAIEHELEKKHPDKAMVKELFAKARPEESTHLNHIKKVCRQELRYFRLRK